MDDLYLSRLEQNRALRRGEPTPCVPIMLPCDPLLFTSEMTALSALIATRCKTWSFLKADPSIAGELPEESGLYLFVWRPGFALKCETPGRNSQDFAYVLYVGEAGADGGAGTIRGRFSSYKAFLEAGPDPIWNTADGSLRGVKLSKLLAVRPLEFWWTTCKDLETLGLLERRLVGIFNPPGNQHYRAQLDESRSVPAF